MHPFRPLQFAIRSTRPAWGGETIKGLCSATKRIEEASMRAKFYKIALTATALVAPVCVAQAQEVGERNSTATSPGFSRPVVAGVRSEGDYRSEPIVAGPVEINASLATIAVYPLTDSTAIKGAVSETTGLFLFKNLVFLDSTFVIKCQGSVSNPFTISANSLSILFTTTIGNKCASNAFFKTNLVCGITPSYASTNNNTPSTICIIRSTSPPKSA